MNTIDIEVPLIAREAQAIKPLCGVADLAQAERVAEEFGGKERGPDRPGPGRAFVCYRRSMPGMVK